jgi:hypothetical protein
MHHHYYYDYVAPTFRGGRLALLHLRRNLGLPLRARSLMMMMMHWTDPATLNQNIGHHESEEGGLTAQLRRSRSLTMRHWTEPATLNQNIGHHESEEGGLTAQLLCARSLMMRHWTETAALIQNIEEAALLGEEEDECTHMHFEEVCRCLGTGSA